jgi:predicted phosphodiesterase
MRALILSDLHLEFRQGKEDELFDSIPKHKVDILLCAGDLTCLYLPQALDHFKRLCDLAPKTLFTAGNHEFYGSSPEVGNKKLDDIEYLIPTLKVLRSGEPYLYDGQRFIGDTMWFIDKPEVHIYKRMINDSYQIKGLFPWAFTQSNLFIVFLRENIKEDDIVITHHIPVDSDTSSIWKNSPTQPYFLNDACNRYFMDPNTIRPKAWIYGHTHDYHSYNIDKTRFICNPVGYRSERNDWKDKVVYDI